MLRALPSIRKKQLVGITGIVLVLFIIGHLSGNLLIFKGAKAFNDYAHFLESLGGLLWAIRIGLLSAFILHIYLTMLIVLENRRARPQNYEVNADHVDSPSFAAKTMRYTGPLILAFVIMHLANFSFGTKQGLVNGVESGLFGLVVNTLSQPLYAAIYIISMIVLGLHLSHSIQSVCQTLGVVNRNVLPIIRKISLAIGVIVMLGFSSIPIYIMVTY